MTSRTRKSNTDSVSENPNMQRVENSWILLATEELLKNDNFSIITLPHPAHGNNVKYCLDDLHNKIYEVVTFDEPYRSWFVGESVKSDGSVQILTPVNPIFLVLPRLREQCSTRAIPLEDLLSEKGFDKITDFIKHLSNVADLKGPADIKAYKYNEEKTLSWLEGRVRMLSKVLKAKNIHVLSGATSATFVASTTDSNHIDEEFYLKYAHGLLSEYLQEDLSEALEKRFDFKPELIEQLAKKRKSENGVIQNSKKIKCEPEEDSKENVIVSPIQNAAKQKPITAKEKARLKAAGGTKTISSFFTKKST